MIDRGTIDRVVEANPIEQVVGEYVRLTRRGANLVGLCPFHRERTPSFSVSPSRGIYKCFGCGQGGNAISFLMELEHVSFLEAVRMLALRANIELEEREESAEEVERRTARDSIVAVLQWARTYYSQQLLESEEGRNVGLSYLRERGVASDVIASFGLGYAPSSGHALLDAARRAGYELDYLVRAGLVIAQDGAHYDRFRERVLFPIQSVSGRTLGFGGRTMRTDKKLAKYINSPEGEVYHKGETLFGLHQARQRIGSEDRCYLVEGYLDVLALHQRGITNVVASSGTALTGDQVRGIARFTKNVTLLYDGDDAGIKAAERGADILLSEGLSVRIVPLPSGLDPDDYARSVSTPELQRYLEEEQVDFIRFRTQRLLSTGQNDPIGRANLAKSLLRSVALVGDPILRHTYLRETAESFVLPEDLLAAELSSIMSATRVAQAREAVRRETLDRSSSEAAEQQSASATTERELVRLLLNHGERTIDVGADEASKLTVAQYVVQCCDEDGIAPEAEVYRLIYESYQGYARGEGANPRDMLLRHERDEVVRMCVELTVSPFPLSKIWFDGQEAPEASSVMLLEHATQCVLAFKSKYLERHLQELLERLRRLPAGEDPSEILSEINRLNAIRSEFAKAMRRIQL